MERITSRTNPLCTHLRKLGASASYRRREGQFLCDSPKLVEEALRWKPDWVSVIVCTEGMHMPEVPAGVRLVEVPGDVMESVSPAKTPQGMLAVCKMPKQELPGRLEGKHYVLLDGVQDPGNVGTILRTADAFWVDGLFLVNGCADLYSPKTVRASMGAVFRCPVWSVELHEAAALLRGSNIPLYGAALREDTLDAGDVDYRCAAVAIGSEGRGLSQEALDLCDRTIKIPMREHCESLNAAAAATVLLWEMSKG